jgi:hypothetical protein
MTRTEFSATGEIADSSKFTESTLNFEHNAQDNSTILPVAHQKLVVDQDEELRTLIRLFSNGGKHRDANQDGGNNHSFKAVQSNLQSETKPALRSATNADALPPPSAFLRRRKSSYAVPMGPSLVQADVEPRNGRVSSADHEPHDEYSVVLSYLMGLHDQPSE